MAQVQLANYISNVLPNTDTRHSADIERKQRSLATSCATHTHFCSLSFKSIGIITGVRSKQDKKRSCQAIRCSLSSASVSEAEDKRFNLKTWDADLNNTTTIATGVEFKLSDFELCSHVSVGLAGRGDEVLFEGVVRNPESPLKGMRVVLRQLDSRRAQRWGQRAVQVLSRLLPREDLKLSYATQVHGYIYTAGSDKNATITLVHGYDGSYSLHQWLHSEDWLSELETRLSLDEEAARRVGDDSTGGPAVSRQLRLVRILMRDILIGVNYLHSRGYAHTQLRLQNLQISESDRHVKVGLLGNAAAFPEKNRKTTSSDCGADSKTYTRQLMIAYDTRCIGFIMAKMILRELMSSSTFALFKNFLAQGHDPAGLREFSLGMLNKGSPSDNSGIQIMDRDGGAGWNLLALMLANKPLDRISFKDALRHPFLCGPMWPVSPSIEMTRWSVGSATVRIVEEYIYGPQQRTRLAKLVDILERMNPNSSSEEWAKMVCGRWRLLYHTGRQIGLTTRVASPAVVISNATLSITRSSDPENPFSMISELGFTAMLSKKWPHDKSGIKGMLKVLSPVISLTDGERSYNKEEKPGSSQTTTKVDDKLPKLGKNRKQRHFYQVTDEPGPATLPIVRIFSAAEVEMEMELNQLDVDASFPHKALSEVRRQIPREMFDLTGFVCGTYIDSRLMVLRGITGSACLFTRSPGTSQLESLG